MPWIEKAQRWLGERCQFLFQQWLLTKSGQEWHHHGQFRTRPKNRCAGNSPYAWGFTLPDYIHDLIAAVGKGDEETAKAIMLYE